MVRASSLCFAILAIKMCMSKRFNKVPESPESMNIKTLWFEGVEDIIENNHLPDDFDKAQETDVVIHGYLVDSSLPEIRDLAFILKKVSFIFKKIVSTYICIWRTSLLIVIKHCIVHHSLHNILYYFSQFSPGKILMNIVLFLTLKWIQIVSKYSDVLYFIYN